MQSLTQNAYLPVFFLVILILIFLFTYFLFYTFSHGEKNQNKIKFPFRYFGIFLRHLGIFLRYFGITLSFLISFGFGYVGILLITQSLNFAFSSVKTYHGGEILVDGTIYEIFRDSQKAEFYKDYYQSRESSGYILLAAAGLMFVLTLNALPSSPSNNRSPTPLNRVAKQETQSTHEEKLEDA